jgi:hypothetical protein
MAQTTYEKCSSSLAIKEMKIKITLRFHLIPVRIPTIKNTTNNMCWRGCGEKGTLIHHWEECKLVQPFWKNIWRLLKNLNIDLPHDPGIPLLEIYPKNVTQVTPKAPAHPCLLQHYSQQPSYGHNQDAPLLTTGSRKCIYTQWNFTQP